jgi:hypothetical protein
MLGIKGKVGQELMQYFLKANSSFMDKRDNPE